MSLYSQLLLLTNHSYALVAHYHLRFFYSSIIFFFLYTWACYPRNTCAILIFEIIFLWSFLWQIKSNKMQYMRRSEMLSFFSSFLSCYNSSFPLSFPTSFLLSFSRMLNYHLICCLSIWLCIHFIPELPSLLNVSCLSP